VVAKAIHELIGFGSCLSEIVFRPAHLVSVIVAFEVHDIHFIREEETNRKFGLNLDELFIFDNVDVLGVVMSKLF